MSKRKNPKTGSPKKTPKFLGETFRGKRGSDALDQLAAIAADLLPEASAHARKGKPRLLAVCARVIMSAQRMRARGETGARKAEYVYYTPRPKRENELTEEQIHEGWNNYVTKTEAEKSRQHR